MYGIIFGLSLATEYTIDIFTTIHTTQFAMVTAFNESYVYFCVSMSLVAAPKKKKLVNYTRIELMRASLYIFSLEIFFSFSGRLFIILS